MRAAYGVTPDIMTFAKGVTSGTVPMGGVVVSTEIHDAFMFGPPHAIEFFHGYTYSAHPLACAAGVAALQLYEDEQLFARAAQLSDWFGEQLHALAGTRHVIDIRNIGMMGAIELEPRAGSPGARAFDAFLALFERGVLVRTTGDILALSPALIAGKPDLERILQTIREVLQGIE